MQTLRDAPSIRPDNWLQEAALHFSINHIVFYIWLTSSTGIHEQCGRLVCRREFKLRPSLSPPLLTPCPLPGAAWLQSAHVHTNNGLPTALLGFETPFDWAWYHSGIQRFRMKENNTTFGAQSGVSLFQRGGPDLSASSVIRWEETGAERPLMHLFLTEDEKEPDLVQMYSKYFLDFFLRFSPYTDNIWHCLWPCSVSRKIVSQLT